MDEVKVVKKEKKEVAYDSDGNPIDDENASGGEEDLEDDV